MWGLKKGLLLRTVTSGIYRVRQVLVYTIQVKVELIKVRDEFSLLLLLLFFSLTFLFI